MLHLRKAALFALLGVGMVASTVLVLSGELIDLLEEGV